MIDWNKRNGGFLDDFNVMNYQVSNLSQQIDKLQQELQRKDNNWNELKKYLEKEISRDRSEDNVWLMGCYDEDREILDKIKELEENTGIEK